MKRKLLTLITALIAVVACALGIAACGGGENGTYYLIKNDGEVDRYSYFELNSGKWTNDENDNGTYKKDGDSITFYITFFGETEIYDSGTLKNDVLKTDGHSYVSEKHNHNYGEWKTENHATCISNGKESRSCYCGVKQTRDSDEQAKGHSPSKYYSFDNTNHYYICTVCNSPINKEPHENSENCSICGYPNPVVNGIRYTLNKNGIATLSEVLITDSEINIPAKITYNGLKYDVTAVSENAFAHCSNLSNISVAEDSVIFSSKDGILYNKPLTKIIYVPEAVTGKITIPDGVTEIEANAFNGRKQLTDVAIPNSITNIGNSAFKDCNALIKINIPDSVTKIGSRAFQGCDGIIQSENGVQYVDKWVIHSDTSVTNVTLRNNTIGIGPNAFPQCTALESITVPSSVKFINEYAFVNCVGLTEIIYSDTKNQWKEAIIREPLWFFRTMGTGTINYIINCTDGKMDRNWNAIN